MFEQDLDHEFHAPWGKERAFLASRICLSVKVVARIGDRFQRLAFGAALVGVLLLAETPFVFGQDTDSEESQLVYPNSSPETEDTEGQTELYKDLMSEGGSGVGMAVTILGYLVIVGGMCVAAWYLFKRGVIRKPFSSSEGKLKVAESRMLGNRQYIMVVEYEDKKILLGVGPGKIDYLTSLDGYRSDFPKIEPELERVSVKELA